MPLRAKINEGPPSIGSTHRCRIIETKGESYRLRDAKAWTRSAKRGTLISGVRDGVPSQPTGAVAQAPATK